MEILFYIYDKFQVWICEFCGNENVIMIEEEEIPKQEDVIYLT